MGGYIAVGVVCLFVGVFVGVLVMSLMAVNKNNEYHVEELDLSKEREDNGDR